jgi:hypothetical protein
VGGCARRASVARRPAGGRTEDGRRRRPPAGPALSRSRGISHRSVSSQRLSRPEALLFHNGAVPAGRDRARDRVVLVVQQVIRQAGVKRSPARHPVILTMGLALAGEQLTERPGGPKAREVGGAQVRLEGHRERHQSELGSGGG